ncbi:hypothetical protein DPX16_23714 [Anabarilius grahami]|uniref:Uncharacterized protein n=1 Tax=Anabarilius grahami TaxID=495550 RepID=A0A3N0YG48_ANAGA|nr:hypothetical protein DPX16_23714 [Anabarilius grahami]
MPRKKTPIVNSSDEADERADIANANASSSTSPLSDAVAEITANISKIIDEKMDPISQLLQLHRSELYEHNKRITEAETRISTLEDVDFSASVLRKRKMFDEVKKRLKSIGAEYRQIFPALLKVNFRGSVKVFHEPAAVEAFINSLDAEPIDIKNPLAIFNHQCLDFMLTEFGGDRINRLGGVYQIPEHAFFKQPIIADFLLR